MEAVFIYFLKANGLLILFFLAYYFLLRKETFFNKNRWFLLMGLFASVLLPLITFTKVIWVDPTPISFEAATNDYIPYIIVDKVIEEQIDWNLILIYTYIGIACLLVLKISIEILSFFRIIKLGRKNKAAKTILIDNLQNENPFSFFNYIVFNSQRFNEEELQHIIAHENIHVNEKHSFDVLIAKIYCAVFWINPIMWFYQKEILQNLEYIADKKASLIAQNRINYQRTLLKVVTHQHQLSITNQFYQSLIKKRIVMLNTNPSNQKNSWKYALILPVLSAFMLLFQVETVAQVKEKKSEKINKIKADTIVWVKDFKDEYYSKMHNDTVYAVEVIQFIINKNTTNAEIKKETERLKKEYNIELEISEIIRNKQNEIIVLDAKFQDENKTTGHISIKSDDPIEPIRFFKELGDNGNVGFDRNDTSTFFTKMDAENDTDKTVGISWEQAVKLSKNQKSNKLYIINGKEYLQSEIPKGTTVEVDGSISELSKEEGIKKYGQKAKDGVLIFEGKSTFVTEEEQIKKVKSEIERAKLEIKNTKEDIEKSKPEIARAKIEIEKAKAEMEKSKIKIELEAQRNSKFSKEELEERRIKIEQLLEERKKMLEERKSKIEESKKENLLNKISYVQFILSNGDGIVIMEKNRIKIPEFPTTMLNNLSLFYNDKKITVDEFNKLNYDLIKSLKVINNEGKTETFKPIREIYFYSK